MIDVAKRMLAGGTLSLEKIAEYSGLSIEEVEALEENSLQSDIALLQCIR